MNTPQIFLTCLSSYNSGHLHGKWIDCIDYDVVMSEWEELQKTAPVEDSEEYFITDYDGFYGYDVNEYENLEELCFIGNEIDSLSEYELTALNYLLEYESLDFDQALSNINEVYYLHGDRHEIVEQYADDFMCIPDDLWCYISYDKILQEIELEYTQIDSTTWASYPR